MRCAHKAYTINDKQAEIAKKVLGANRVAASKKFRPDSEVKYYLSKTDYRFLPMSPKQKIYINHAIAYGKDPKQYLSPSQILMYNRLRKKQAAKKQDFIVSDDLVGNWEKVLGGE